MTESPSREPQGLRPFEQHAIDAILDRPSADPDDDAAIAARAAVRLAQAAAAARAESEVAISDLIAELDSRAAQLEQAPAARAEVAPLDTRLRGDGPCEDCGTLDNIVWFTDNVFWNAVTGANVVHEEPQDNPILCIPCFVTRADRKGLWPTGWRLLPDWPWRERHAP